MALITEDVAPLVAGDRLCRDEFFRRWEAMPRVEKAELIGGIVYMPSPLSLEHGDAHSCVIGWLAVFAAATPGCRSTDNATWLMLDDAPQPDACLRILPEFGGQSRVSGRYGAGAPELIVEICSSSTAYDLHQKLDLYLAAGVQEYVTVLLREREVRWHRRVAGTFELLPTSTECVIHSVVFPGLWLDVPALVGGDMNRVLRALNQGLQTADHADFAARLAQKRS